MSQLRKFSDLYASVLFTGIHSFKKHQTISSNPLDTGIRRYDFILQKAYLHINNLAQKAKLLTGRDNSDLNFVIKLQRRFNFLHRMK